MYEIRVLVNPGSSQATAARYLYYNNIAVVTENHLRFVIGRHISYKVFSLQKFLLRIAIVFSANRQLNM